MDDERAEIRAAEATLVALGNRLVNLMRARSMSKPSDCDLFEAALTATWAEHRQASVHVYTLYGLSERHANLRWRDEQALTQSSLSGASINLAPAEREELAGLDAALAARQQALQLQLVEHRRRALEQIESLKQQRKRLTDSEAKQRTAGNESSEQVKSPKEGDDQ